MFSNTQVVKRLKTPSSVSSVKIVVNLNVLVRTRVSQRLEI